MQVLLMTISILWIRSAEGTTPIVVGTWTNFGYPDFIAQQATTPLTISIRAVARAVNAAGGIHGRPLQIVECEAALNNTKYQLCLRSMLAQYPDMIAVMGIFLDSTFQVMQPLILQEDIMLVNPMILTSRQYDRHWFYAKAGTSLLLTTMLGYVVSEIRALRIGLMWDPNTYQSIHTSPIAQATELILQLGLQHVGTLGLHSGIENSNGKWKTQEYFDFLDTRPQVIISIGGATQTTFEMWLDIFNRSAHSDRVDPNLKVVMWEGSSFVASLAIQYLTGIYKVNISAKDRLYVAIGNPTMVDARYTASAHALRDLTAYYNSTAYLKQNAFFFVGGMQGWITARLLVAALEKMNPSNLTRQSLMDFMQADTMLVLDDLYFGPFTSRPCTTNPAPNGPCECNDGYRTMETYSFDASGALVKAEGRSRFDSSIASCGAAVTAIPPPLIYLSSSAETSSSLGNVADDLLAGAIAAFNALPDMTALSVARGEHCSASSDLLLRDAVSNKTNTTFVSLIFPAVLSDATTKISSLFTVDPFYLPAQLAPPFSSTTIHIMATLQQELFALAQFVAQDLPQMTPVYAVTRGSSATAQSIVSTFSASLLSYGVSLAASRIIADPSMPIGPYLAGASGGSQLVIGLGSKADVIAVVHYLQSNPTSRVMLSFNELSAWYEDIVALATNASVETRIYFATSLRNWNAPNLTSNLQSTLMVSYFAAFPNASLRSPRSLRGFVVGAAVQRVAGQVLPAALTPEGLQRMWFAISVIPLSSTDLVGAYSQAPCFSSLDSSCETNTGARTAYVMRLGDVTTRVSSVQNYSSTTVFASGRIAYVIPSPTGTGLSEAVLIGIIVACVIGGIVVLCLTMLNASRKAKRNNRNAPQDPSRPLCIIFTDIQSSTAIWAACPESMAEALDLHHSLMRRLIKQHDCYEVKTIGDAFMVATSNPIDAIKFAVSIQTEFYAQSWPKDIDRFYIQAEKEHCTTTGQPIPAMLGSAEAYGRCWNGLRVRVGINYGLADIKLDDVTGGFDYYGSTVNVAARTEGYSSGGQILLAPSFYQQLQIDRSKDSVIDKLFADGLVTTIGEVELKGISDKVELYQVTVMEARQFHIGRRRNLGDEEDDHLEVEEFSSDETDSVAEMKTSISSSAHALAAMKYSRSDWNSVVVAVIATLLSTWPEAPRSKVLQECCDRWHISVPGAWSKRHHHGHNSLALDPFVQVLSKRIGPVIKNKFRVLPPTEGNFAESRVSETPSIPPM